jgi:hypothetical protein
MILQGLVDDVDALDVQFFRFKVACALPEKTRGCMIK